LVFLIVTPLAITITMYHGYLGEAIKFKEVLADLKKYALRWIGIFLLYIPSLVIIILTYRIINTMNFMLYIFIFNLLGGLFGSFFFGYIKLEIIRNDSGIWDALKHGARVWIKRPLVKTMIVLVFSFLQLIVSLLIVTTQKGISMIIFSMRYQEYATLLKPLMPRLLINIFDAVCTPLFLAFIMSAYFGELQMMEPNETRPNLI